MTGAPGSGSRPRGEARRDPLSILFIGNSHTYMNDLPLLVKRLAEDAGLSCRVTMLAHGGWHLADHLGEPEARFNVAFGGHDYVVLQEHAHPFGPEERTLASVKVLCRLIRAAGSVPVLFSCWARKAEPDAQEGMDLAHERIAAEAGAILAPVGRAWGERLRSDPGTDLYAEDGEHASPAGSRLAAAVLWEAIRAGLEKDGGRAFVREEPERG